MTEISLSFLKIASGILLALSAFLGSLVPELLLRSSKPGEFATTILPIGNALSAGLLFGAGMLHFFAEGTAQLAVVASSGVTTINSSSESSIKEIASSGFAKAAPAMMAGYLISLILDRVVLERLKKNKRLPDWISQAQHSHSHGTPDDHHLDHYDRNYDDNYENDNNRNKNGENNTSSDNIDRDEASENNNKADNNNERRSSITKENVDVSVSIPHQRQRSGENKSENHSSNTNNNNINNSASSNASGSTSTSCPTSPKAGDFMIKPNHHHQNSSATSTSTVLTIAVLMSLHSAIEGTTLALETSAKTLRGAFVPLFIHRFFDGVVVGLQATVVSASDSNNNNNDKNNSSVNNKNENAINKNDESSPCQSCSQFIKELTRIVFRKATLVLLAWSVITPVVLILVLLLKETNSSTSGASSSSNSNNSSNNSPSSVSFAGAWAQCFAAGSFVYISGELLNDVFSKSPTSVMMMNAAKDWISVNIGNMNARVLGLIVGVGIVLGLEATEG